MRRPRSATRELIAAVISGLVAVLGAVDLIGHPARGGFTSGIAFGRAVDRRRAERRVTASAP